MKRNLEIQNELAQLTTSVADIPFVNVYSIPDTYFDNLPQSVLRKLQPNVLSGVPEGYFEKLPDLVMNKIKLNQTEQNNDELPETLKALQKLNVYKVPEGYFDNIRLPQHEAKIVTIQKNRFSKLLKIAAAACVISIISFVSYTFISKANKKTKTDNEAVAEFKVIRDLNIDKEITKLNEKEVDNYFCDAGLIACTDVDNEPELEKQLEDLNISDEEMETLFETSNN
jgi:hypothetical protein